MGAENNRKVIPITDYAGRCGYVYLALAGTNKLPGLFYHLEQEDDINQVLIAFDNGDARKAALIGLDNMGIKGNAKIFAPSSRKDWNDYIKFCEIEYYEN